MAKSALSLVVTPMISITFNTPSRNSYRFFSDLDLENTGGFIQVKSQILAIFMITIELDEVATSWLFLAAIV